MTSSTGTKSSSEFDAVYGRRKPLPPTLSQDIDWELMAKRAIRAAAALFVCASALIATAQSAPSTTNVPQPPIRVEITKQSEPQSGRDKWVTLIGQIAWPIVAVFAAFLFRKPLTNFLDTVAKRATKFSIGALGIELATMNEAQLGDDLLTFRTADPFTVVGSSAKRTLFDMFEKPGTFEFVSINLGRGDDWVSSRLYIFAVMLQRMKSLRCIVFVQPGPETESKFLGATTPEAIRWSLARLQPWLEVAYENAYQQVLFPPPIPPNAPAPVIEAFVKNERGAVDPQKAKEIVKNFLLTVRANAPIPGTKASEGWVMVGNDPEHATKLSGQYLEAELGQILWKDTVRSSETKKEAKALLRCTAPFVAKIKRNGEFVALIDRVVFLDEVVARISDKLDGAS